VVRGGEAGGEREVCPGGDGGGDGEGDCAVWRFRMVSLGNGSKLVN